MTNRSRRSAGRVAGIIAGLMLVLSMAGTAAAGIGGLSHVTIAGPDPADTPLGTSSSYDVVVHNAPQWVNRNVTYSFTITGANGIAGLSVTSAPCVQLSGYTHTTMSGVVVQTDPATTPLTNILTGWYNLTITQWQGTACSGTPTDTLDVTSYIHVVVGDQTITFPTITDKTYGDGPLALGATASSGLAVSYSTSGPCTESGGSLTLTGVGTCSVTASQAGDSRWNAAAPVNHTFDIDPAVLTVTPDNQSRPYGSANPTLTVGISGFVNGESAAVLSGNAAVSTTAIDSSPVGPYAITATVGTLSAANYSFSFAPGTLTVTAVQLTVTANDETKTQGDPNPPFAATITGFVLSDDNSALTSAPSCSSAATDGSPVGTYPITCDGAAAGNYSFHYVDGTLHVVAGAVDHIVISPADATINAGDTQTYTAEGFDAGNNSTGDVTASTAFTVGGGSCTGAVCGSTVAGDHTVSGTVGTASDTAALHVLAGPADHLVISPDGASITPGSTQAFSAELFDEFGNSLGDVTAQTTFSIDGAGSCTGTDCGAPDEGDYSVTGVADLGQGGRMTASATLHITAAEASPTEIVGGETSGPTPPPTGTGGSPTGGNPLPMLLLIAAALGTLGVLAADMQRRANLTGR